MGAIISFSLSMHSFRTLIALWLQSFNSNEIKVLTKAHSIRHLPKSHPKKIFKDCNEKVNRKSQNNS